MGPPQRAGHCRADLVMAQTVLGLPWLADGVSQAELWTLTDLRNIAQQDTGVARKILALPWLADDITPGERSVFVGLRRGRPGRPVGR